MEKVIGVRFKPVGKVYYFSPLKFEVKKGDKVIVETSRGIEYGEVVIEPKEIDDAEIIKPLKTVIRIANDSDHAHFHENKSKEKDAMEICRKKIEKHKLQMNLVDAEYTFDGNKLLFYFTADGRIDFRELVKDLAIVFKTRIEMRQIGVRDESKLIGSVGVCGRNICCNQFLGDFVPVSIKMAKEQGLSLNPTKISGICGRLMCCLKYEQNVYEELSKITPRQGAIVQTPDGKGVVESVSILKGDLRVRLDGEGEQTIKDYKVEDIKILKNSKRTQHEEIDEELLKKLEDN